MPVQVHACVRTNRVIHTRTRTRARARTRTHTHTRTHAHNIRQVGTSINNFMCIIEMLLIGIAMHYAFHYTE